MTKRECAIVSAYTGVLIGKFSRLKEYVEELLGMSVLKHEMQELSKLIKEKSKNDFQNINITE